MNVRLKKEFQSLFWPWLVAALMGFLPLAVWWATSIMFSSPSAAYDLLNWRQNAYFIANSTYVLGVAILAALPFGRELQERTFYLLFSQPYPRLQLWREKLLVALVAILTLTAVHAVGYLTSPAALLPNIKFAGILILIVFGSGVFWSVTSRSVVGGIVLSLFSLAALFLSANALTDNYIYIQGLAFYHHRTYLLLYIAAFIIAPLFFNLAWRKFSRLQLAGNVEAEVELPRLPDRQDCRANWVRSRADNPLFNLVLKELRMLKPAFQFMLLFIALWVVAAVLPGQVVFLKNFAFLYLPIFTVLVGCVTLGSEKRLGIHSANLASPIPISTQWLIKNSLACLIGLAGTIFPLLIMPRITNIYVEPAFFKFLVNTPFALATVCLLILTLVQISFTAATIANELLHAIFLTVVIVSVSVAVFAGGFLLGHQLDLPVHKLAYVLVAYNQQTAWSAQRSLEIAAVWVWAFSCLSLIYAGWKNFRLLKSETQNLLLMMKYLLICTLSFGTLHGTLHKSLDRNNFTQSALYLETKAAFLALGADIYESESYHEEEVPYQELLATGMLSSLTQTWLRDCTFKTISGTVVSAGKSKPVIRVIVQFPYKGRSETVYLNPRTAQLTPSSTKSE